MQEKYAHKGKKVYYAFVLVKKALDRIARKLTRLALRKIGVEEWLVNAFISMKVHKQ